MSMDFFKKFGDNGVLSKRFELRRKLGSGAFGEVFVAYDREEKLEVAVKIENETFMFSPLSIEVRMYRGLKSFDNVPKMKHHGYDGRPFLVMDLLGPSLHYLFKMCNKQFSLKTVLMLSTQMISCIENIHSKSIVHQDIKANNFVMGTGHTKHLVFLIDFGLAEQYRENNEEADIHEESEEGNDSYISYNGWGRSRRIDLESVGVVLTQFLRGENSVFYPEGHYYSAFPTEFGIYMKYCEGLKDHEEPDYQFLRNLFTCLMNRCGFEQDFQYDWTILELELEQHIKMTQGSASTSLTETSSI